MKTAIDYARGTWLSRSGLMLEFSRRRGWILSSLGSLTATWVNQVALMVSGIITARSLGPDGRGQLALLMIIAGIVGLFARLGSNSALAYFVAKNSDHAGSLVRLMLKPIVAQVLVCLIGQAIWIQIVVRGGDPQLQLAALISLLIGPANIIQSHGLAILQGLRKFRQYNILRSLSVSLNSLLLLTVAALSLQRITVFVSVYALASMIAAAVTAVAVFASIRAEPESAAPATRREITLFGAKSFLGTASPLDTLRLDQMVIGLLLSPAALGVYVASLSFTNLPRMISRSFSSVAFPYIARKANKEQARRLMWTSFGISLLGMLSVVLVVGIWAEPIVRFTFGEAFIETVPVIRILLISALFIGSRRFLSEAMMAMGAPMIGTTAELISWLTIVPLLFVMTHVGELKGVALAITVSSLLSLLVTISLTIRGTRSTPQHLISSIRE